jgi:hypothetical protein
MSSVRATILLIGMTITLLHPSPKSSANDFCCGAIGVPGIRTQELSMTLFPTASYQYILYGMGFETVPQQTFSHRQQRLQASELFRKNAARAAQLQQALPGNRELLNKVREFGFQKL